MAAAVARSKCRDVKGTSVGRATVVARVVAKEKEVKASGGFVAVQVMELGRRLKGPGDGRRHGRAHARGYCWAAGLLLAGLVVGSQSRRRCTV